MPEIRHAEEAVEDLRFASRAQAYVDAMGRLAAPRRISPRFFKGL
jgi:hypothetical protein